MIDMEKILFFAGEFWTLQDTSRDTNNPERYVTDAILTVVNFDIVQKEYYHKLARDNQFGQLLGRKLTDDDLPKSADALYYSSNDELFLIEFKLSKRNTKSREIREKALESLFSLMEITQIDRDYARNNITFIVAYYEVQKPSRSKIHERVSSLANKTPILFDLERYKGLYFKEILTLDHDKFDEYIKKEGWTSMNEKTKIV